jgi:hypothetical protein
MNLNPLNPHYRSYMFAEFKAQSEKLRHYPRHSVDCIIHIEPGLCNCGTEEEDEEQGRQEFEEAEIETQENDND